MVQVSTNIWGYFVVKVPWYVLGHSWLEASLSLMEPLNPHILHLLGWDYGHHEDMEKILLMPSMGNLDHSFIDLSLQERGWEEALYDGFGGLDIPIRGLSSQLSEWVRLFRGLEDFQCGMRCSLHIGLVGMCLRRFCLPLWNRTCLVCRLGCLRVCLMH